MREISLKKVIPSFLEELNPLDFHSEVWGNEISFRKGGSYLIKAASGRGKTTLLGELIGLRTDYTGDILFDGEKVFGFSHNRWAAVRSASFSTMFQDLLLFDELTPLENVRIKPMARAVSDTEVREMLGRLGIGNKANVKVRRLSFGQKQRVAFVRMLCQDADFLLMDEPVSHLDAANCEIMAAMLAERVGKDGAGVIITSIGRDLPYNYDKEIHL
ncbi:MAG: ATP-binding cassette domain-containing protein [Bacteroidales bacterium]|nr:ATP-binding cassette domain-containing protein [Bacteroidales bacterium]